MLRLAELKAGKIRWLIGLPATSVMQHAGNMQARIQSFFMDWRNLLEVKEEEAR
jgi:hypothetical protein